MTELTGRRALAVVVAAFVANGVGVGVIGGLIPTFTTRWATDARGIGALLVVAGVAAIAGINLGGRIADARGALRPMVTGAVVMALGVLGLGLVDVLWAALLVGLCYGFGNGLLDCTMNAMAVQVEGARPRPLMSRFHACWSVGSLVGAGLVLGLGRLADSPAAVATIAVLVPTVSLIVVSVAIGRSGTNTAIVRHRDASGARRAIPRESWLLGMMAVCFGITEGTAMDWSSVHAERVAHLSAAAGAVGLVAVATFMVTVRFAGDAIVHRLGRRAVVRGGAGLAAVGYLVAATAHGLPMVLLGWCVVGAGTALVAPQIYGLAGMFGGGRGLSVVVTMGYVAFLAGPGIMGALVHVVGVQQAMFWPLVLALALSSLAFVMPTERDAGRLSQ